MRVENIGIICLLVKKHYSVLLVEKKVTGKHMSRL